MTNSIQPTATLYEIEDGFAVPVSGGQLTTVATTGAVQPIRRQGFQKGQSGNPAGRKPGSRNRITELFISAMRDDFAEHGAEAIAELRQRDPAQYLAAVRSIVPTKLIEQHEAKEPDLATMSDAEWADAMDGNGGMRNRMVREQRRKRAVEMAMSGEAPSVAEAMRMLGADV